MERDVGLSRHQNKLAKGMLWFTNLNSNKDFILFHLALNEIFIFVVGFIIPIHTPVFYNLL